MFFPNSRISAPARKVLFGAQIITALIFLFFSSSITTLSRPFLTSALIAFTGGLFISIKHISSIFLKLTTLMF